MVIFEGIDFVPFEIDKFESDLRRALIGVEVDFLQKMHTHFRLLECPRPIGIDISSGSPGFNFEKMKIQLGYNSFDFVPNKCLDSLNFISHECAHETGHYAHYLANKSFMEIKTKKTWKIKSKKDRDIYLLREVVAELGALTFFDISGRDFPRDIVSHHQHPLMNAIYDFYCEKGKDYCLETIKSLVGLSLNSRNYKDIMDIGRKGWFNNPRIK